MEGWSGFPKQLEGESADEKKRQGTSSTCFTGIQQQGHRCMRVAGKCLQKMGTTQRGVLRVARGGQWPRARQQQV